MRENGTVTAGNASGVNDGSVALLLASAAAVQQHGLKARGKIVAMATSGVAPRIMGIGPVTASQKALKLAGLTLDQMDLVELNEAFAAQALSVMRGLGLADDAAHVNPRRADGQRPLYGLAALTMTQPPPQGRVAGSAALV